MFKRRELQIFVNQFEPSKPGHPWVIAGPLMEISRHVTTGLLSHLVNGAALAQLTTAMLPGFGARESKPAVGLHGMFLWRLAVGIVVSSWYPEIRTLLSFAISQWIWGCPNLCLDPGVCLLEHRCYHRERNIDHLGIMPSHEQSMKLNHS